MLLFLCFWRQRSLPLFNIETSFGIKLCWQKVVFYMKKGLKLQVKWFTMVSSGRKWRVVVQNGEDIPVLEEGELHVERRIQS